MAVSTDSERAVDEARARFRRTLSAWVMDVLELRRRGLHRPVLQRAVADAEEDAAAATPAAPARGARGSCS